MDEKELTKMIEAFFEASLTLDEERRLCHFLRNNEVPVRLQKEKEMIMALCGDYLPDDALPMGAAARIEALLDNMQLQADDKELHNKRKLPTLLWYAASIAAACIAAIVILYSSNDIYDTDNMAIAHKETQEVDTYSSPQEAVVCMQAVLSDLRLCANNTQKNIKAVSGTIKQSAYIHCCFINR